MSGREDRETTKRWGNGGGGQEVKKKEVNIKRRLNKKGRRY